MIKYLLLILYIPTIIFAETRTYLIYREDNFSQDRYWYATDVEGNKFYKYFVDMGYKKIEDVPDCQPFRVTNYEINYNGKYALLTCEDTLPDNEYFKLLSTFDVRTIYDEKLGGHIRVPITNKYDDIPDDYYVEISTTIPAFLETISSKRK